MRRAALTTGEEQEQIFSKMSRYNIVSKHMGKSSNVSRVCHIPLFANTISDYV